MSKTPQWSQNPHRHSRIACWQTKTRKEMDRIRIGRLYGQIEAMEGIHPARVQREKVIILNLKTTNGQGHLDLACVGM